MAKLRFGIKTAPQHTTYEAMLARLARRPTPSRPSSTPGSSTTSRRSSATSTDRAWRAGRCWPPSPPGPTASPLGLMVTGNTYRHPAVLAHIAATVDVIANGRLDFGIGAGWNEYEHASMGIPLYAAGRAHPAAGRGVRADQAALHPAPDRLRRALLPAQGGALRAEAGPEALPAVRHRRRRRATDAARGRPPRRHLELRRRPAEIFTPQGRRCCTTTAPPSGATRPRSTLSIQFRVNYDDLAETTQAVQELVDAGATHVVLNLTPPFPDGIVARLAEEVIPSVRA